jgi:hypothetical protein
MLQPRAWKGTRRAACWLCWLIQNPFSQLINHIFSISMTMCILAQALMYHLTGGNAREMRKFGTGLLY